MSVEERFFRQNGYLIAREVFGSAECGRLAESIVSGAYPDGWVDRDGQCISRLESAVENLDLIKWLDTDKFHCVVRRLVGADWVLLENRHNHATVDFGKGTRGVRLHRDSLQWSRPFLTAILFLSGPADAFSWPRIVPGSHLWPIEAESNGGGYWMDEDSSAGLSGQALPVQMESGDLLFLDPLTFHAAGTGIPTDSRVVLTLAIRSIDELSTAIASNEVLMAGKDRYAGQERWLQRYGR